MILQEVVLTKIRDVTLKCNIQLQAHAETVITLNLHYCFYTTVSCHKCQITVLHDIITLNFAVTATLQEMAN